MTAPAAWLVKELHAAATRRWLLEMLTVGSVMNILPKSGGAPRRSLERITPLGDQQDRHRGDAGTREGDGAALLKPASFSRPLPASPSPSRRPSSSETAPWPLLGSPRGPARHRTFDGQGSERPQIIGPAASLVDSAEIPLTAVEGVAGRSLSIPESRPVASSAAFETTQSLCFPATRHRVNACMAASRDAAKPYAGSPPSLKAIHPPGLLWSRRDRNNAIRPTMCRAQSLRTARNFPSAEVTVAECGDLFAALPAHLKVSGARLDEHRAALPDALGVIG
jgi:hypothetical protein